MQHIIKGLKLPAHCQTTRYMSPMPSINLVNGSLQSLIPYKLQSSGSELENTKKTSSDSIF